MLTKSKTQQAVADELGWSRDKVAKFATLQEIDEKAWKIVTTIIRDGMCRQDDDVTTVVTSVTFTETLLRALPPLRADQQHELCRFLARGKRWPMNCDEAGNRLKIMPRSRRLHRKLGQSLVLLLEILVRCQMMSWHQPLVPWHHSLNVFCVYCHR
jgi:hypothetical protein